MKIKGWIIVDLENENLAGMNVSELIKWFYKKGLAGKKRLLISTEKNRREIADLCKALQATILAENGAVVGRQNKWQSHITVDTSWKPVMLKYLKEIRTTMGIRSLLQKKNKIILHCDLSNQGYLRQRLSPVLSKFNLNCSLNGKIAQITNAAFCKELALYQFLTNEENKLTSRSSLHFSAAV